MNSSTPKIQLQWRVGGQLGRKECAIDARDQEKVKAQSKIGEWGTTKKRTEGEYQQQADKSPCLTSVKMLATAGRVNKEELCG
jgi:hypothetical protein